jgi:hypothetical protein
LLKPPSLVYKELMERMSGVKYDQEKVRMELLDPQAMMGLAAVLTFGSKKYGAENWRLGISNSRLWGALLRHGFAILRGEDVDPESGLPHIDHLGCCWMFLSWNYKSRPELDDRRKE